MKSFRLVVLTTLLGLPALAQVQVAATTPILADLVAQVGGDRVKVAGLVPLGADPHTFEPRPSAVRMLSRARILFANGLGLETYLSKLRPLLPQGAKVVELAPDQPDLICGLLGLREKGVHLHGDCDPHLWLDPTYAVRYAERIAKELSLLDPEGKAYYEERLKAFRAQALAEDQALAACLEGKRLRVIVTHLSLLYFARRYGVEIVGALMDAHAQETGPRTRIALLKEAQTGRVDFVVAEPQFPKAKAEALAKELNLPVLVLYTDALDSRVPTYLDLLRYNRKVLCEVRR
ncbi:MAG: metal ABC transporter substrate-binding protein [Thermaceae bacterium]